MSESIVFLDTELRKLRPAELYTLGQILNISDSWKRLLAIVPKEDASNLPKFNTEHVSMIEQAAQQQRRNAAEIFLSEWGTMGKSRPTLRVLLNLLVKAELFRAADYLAGDILKEEPPKRPECGPAAPVDISDEVIRKLLEDKEEFENLGFNESLMFALPSESNDNEVINPNAINNESDNSSLERNMQSTKLVSTKGKYNETDIQNAQGTLKAHMSDLMKFSSKQNVPACREVFEEQEMSSRELPVFLNEFGRSMKHTNTNYEVLTEDLPVFLNYNTTMPDNVLPDDNQIGVLMRLSNLNINRNEMNSTELPECIVELGGNSTSNINSNHVTENNDNMPQNVLTSQELPISVLEYNE